MYEPLWEYAEELSTSGDPDSVGVRGLVQSRETDADFQDTVGRLNDLYEFQQQARAKGDEKPAPKRQQKS
jgi:hypothetical protein